jgi:hypothetical protein
MERLEHGELASTIHAPVREAELEHLVDGALVGVARAGPWVFSHAWLEEFRSEVDLRLAEADPLDPGSPKPPDPWAEAITPLLGLEGRGAKLYRPGATPELGERGAEAAELEARLGLDPVRAGDRRLARFLEDAGRLVQVGNGFAISPEAYEQARRALVEECEAGGRITLARFRDLLGISRRSAQLLLERFDADGVTRRVGDERVLRRNAARG